MPIGNAFAHQPYSACPPAAPYELIGPIERTDSTSRKAHQQMLRVSDRMRTAGVTAVYLVHGTFVGDDSLGIIRELERWSSRAGITLRRQQKRLFDRLVRHAGDFSDAYARRLAELLNEPHSTGPTSKRPIAVRQFIWSGENIHLGRADAAVRLLRRLGHDRRSVDRTIAAPRYVLCGHSHAGNVFALLTHLLAADDEVVAKMFRAARPFYTHPLLRTCDVPYWPKVARNLHKLRRSVPPLDLVTFGTPIRYGWESRGYRTLTHFVHHRPQPGTPEYLALPPRSIREATEAVGGDYVQLMAIAGTNLTLLARLAQLARGKTAPPSVAGRPATSRHGPSYPARPSRAG